MNRVIVAGSPRSNGRSARLAEMLFEANIDECPEDEIYLVPVSELEISPCIACGACRNEVEIVYEPEDGESSKGSGEDAEVVVERGHRCVIDDEMQDVYPLLDAADELTVVAPVFFSGAPASLKALLDRLQPYFWADTRKNPKRPATLHVIGEGGDPHGYAPLVSEVRSALAVAGFRLERVLDWVGKIDESGEITAEAEVVEDAARSGEGTKTPATSAATQAQTAAAAAAGPASAEEPTAPAKRRPKLDLSSTRSKAREANNDHDTRGHSGPRGGKEPQGKRPPKGKSAQSAHGKSPKDAGQRGKGQGQSPKRGKSQARSAGQSQARNSNQGKGKRRG